MIAGCTMIPKYERPGMSVSNSWPTGTAYLMTGSDGKAADIAWKDYFMSDSMREVISRALDNNRDLRIAVLNIEAARAAYQIQKTQSLPTVNATASAARTAVPENASSSGASITSSSFSANVGFSAYELDFFGRVKSLNQKALETYLATEQAQKTARISLIAETANAYLTYIGDKQLLGLAQKTYDAQKKTYDLVKRKYEIGTATQLEVAQADTSVQSAKANIAQYTRLAAQAKNALTLLTGTSVDDLLNNSDTIDSVKVMNDLPVGLPSNVLLARPDIMQAEHALKAANADIGAARAAMYPTISLTASAGLASDSLTNLFSSGSALAWNFAPSVSIPIFNRGKLKASLETAQVNEKISAAEYEKAVQTAFKEVADQLAARGTYKSQLEAQTALVKSTQKAYDLSSIRYKNGIDTFLTVLDSQRSLFSAQESEVNVKQAYLTNLVTLYKVLGGGQL